MTEIGDALRVPTLSIAVLGVPAPQGSKSFKGLRAGKSVLVESCTAVAPWRAAVVRATTLAMRQTASTMITGPSTVVIDFYLPRPASAPRHRTVPDRGPDLDKLIRAQVGMHSFSRRQRVSTQAALGPRTCRWEKRDHVARVRECLRNIQLSLDF